jgi:hypothetical protein
MRRGYTRLAGSCVDGLRGPMDLLLDLAEQQRIELGRISIVALVEQFVAAATLMAAHVPVGRRADWLVNRERLALLRSRACMSGVSCARSRRGCRRARSSASMSCPGLGDAGAACRRLHGIDRDLPHAVSGAGRAVGAGTHSWSGDCRFLHPGGPGSPARHGRDDRGSAAGDAFAAGAVSANDPLYFIEEL